MRWNKYPQGVSGIEKGILEMNAIKDSEADAMNGNEEMNNTPEENNSYSEEDNCCPEENNCCCEENSAPVRKKVRDEKLKKDLMNRLKRIEGQVRGLERMLDEDAYCPEILTQASAVNSAVNSFCRELLANHLRTCVTQDILAGREDTADELMDLLKKLMK